MENVLHKGFVWGAAPLACVQHLSLPQAAASAPAAAQGESSWVGQGLSLAPEWSGGRGKSY